MNELDPFFHYPAHSRAFLSRAREHLSHFEINNQVQHFFYAALELRFGIEARLNEYLAPALKETGKDHKEVSEYVATKLIKRLAAIDPTSEQPASFRFTSEQTGSFLVAHYTPVSRRLAAIHGQLGELLHYKFFTKNEHWFLRKPLGGNPSHSILDFVALMNEGVAELAQATTGKLLANPQFTALVNEVLSENVNKRS